MPAADTRYLYRLALPCCGAESRTSLPRDVELAALETVRLYCPFCLEHHEGQVLNAEHAPEVIWR